MPRKKLEEFKEVHKVGDKIWWKGIMLTVTAVYPDGKVEAMSQTMRVTVPDHDGFEKYHVE